MTAAARVLVVGESLIDVVITSDGLTMERPGGSPANVALTMGRLGYAVTLLTRVGADDDGQRIRDWLAASRVQVDHRSSSPLPTSRAIARLDQTGAAEYDLDIRWDLPFLNVDDIDLLHIGSISAILGPGDAAVLDIVDQVGKSGLVSYDPNIRPALIQDSDATRARVEELVSRADIVKVSDEDLTWLDPTHAPQEIAARWMRGRTSLVVITRGSAGVTALTPAGDEVFAPARSVHVEDSVGAGDTFMGALLTTLGDLGVYNASPSMSPHQRLARVDSAALESTLEFCTAAAAVTVSRVGADPPWQHELGDGFSSRVSPDPVHPDRSTAKVPPPQRPGSR